MVLPAHTNVPVFDRHDELLAAVAGAMGVQRKVTSCEVQRAFVAQDLAPLARRVEKAARGRHALAHPDGALIAEVVHALGQSPSGAEGESNNICASRYRMDTPSPPK